MTKLKAQHFALAGLMLALPAEVHAFYAKNSPVTLVTAKNFKEKVLLSNYTSLVEFYAPWCGHCQNLKPTYEKVAENLKGLANIYAIDCDQDDNQPFCSEQKVQGFPTIKRFTPEAGVQLRSGEKLPRIEDYQGPRTASGLRDYALETMPNHVTRLDSKKKFDEFLSKGNETAKVILFTNKGTISPLYKSVAIEFKGSLKFAQVRDNQKEAVAAFGVTEYPRLILLPGGDAEGKVYDGKMKKEEIVKFVSQVAEPNKGVPSAPPAKKTTAKSAKKEDKGADDEKPTEEAKAAPEPPKIQGKPIPALESMKAFEDACMSRTSKAVCILAIIPPVAPSLTALEHENALLHSAGSKNFPFYQIPRALLSKEVIEALEVDKEVTEELDEEKPGPVVVRAVNGRRKWYKKFAGDAASSVSLQTWLDDIKMGEGKKYKFDLEVEEEKKETEDKKEEEKPAEDEAKKEEEAPKEEEKKEEEEKPKKAPVHEEL